MKNAYQPELWQNVFVVLGSSSAALIGLLFIATSLHLDEIINNPILRRRASNNTRYLLVTFVEALLILIPQPMPILGAELVAVNLFGLSRPLINIYNYFRNKKGFVQAGATIYRAIIFVISFLLGTAGGAAILIERLNLGIYLVTASCIILVVTIVLNAWSIMLGVGLEEKKAKAK
jgi:hypothetical protein